MNLANDFTSDRIDPSVRGKILLVEDDRVAAMTIAALLADLGYHVETSGDGAEAYLRLREEPCCADVILTDRFMPMLDGLGLTRRLKREIATRSKPVVMMTGADDTASIAEGVAAGVFHYLTKPVDGPLLKQVLEAAFASVARQNETIEALRRHQSGFALAMQMSFQVRDTKDVSSVASLMASMSEDPDRACAGLRELLANAVEHGLYRLGGAAKARHQAAGTLDVEMASRAASDSYQGHVEAASQRTATGVRFLIRDPGPGFDWRSELRADPTRSTSVTGHGLIRATTIFSELRFNSGGNLVAATIDTERRKVW